MTIGDHLGIYFEGVSSGKKGQRLICSGGELASGQV